MADCLGDVVSNPHGAFCAIHPTVAAVATCDHCGTFACPDCVTLHRGKQICATCIERGRVTIETNPWQQRDTLGIPVAWWRTVMQITMSPSTFFRSLSPQGGLGEALGFASLSLLPALLVGFASQTAVKAMFGPALFDAFQSLIEQSGALSDLPADTMSQIESLFVVTPAGLIGGLFSAIGLGLPFALVLLAFLGVVQHVALMLLGGGKEGFEATLKAAFYGAAVRFWEVIPPVAIFAGLWVLFVQGVGFGAIHKTQGWKGQLAAWAPALTCCFCVMGTTAMVAILGASFASGQ